MDDIGSAIQNFLAQPGAMEQVEAMAKQLGLGQSASPPDTGDAPSPAQPVPPELPSDLQQGGIPPELLRTLMGVLQDGGGNRSAALMEALRPMLSGARQEKLDRAAKALRMLNMARSVSRTLGTAMEL